MTKVAIYARYSCERQSDTSLEDQVRRCKELAGNFGLTVSDELIFTDAAVSGTDKGDGHRPGYAALLAAWDAGGLDAVLADEFSRLSRDGVEQAKLIKRLENGRRVRLLTADGVDTNSPGSALLLSIKGAIAQQEIRGLRHRVGRGMQGQLERGYMIAAAAFGYGLERCFDSASNRIGTHWVIDEKNAALVREIYARRVGGESMHQIAAWLNTSGVPCQRKGRCAEGNFWRPSRVRSLLINPIYRGVFVWHGSTTYAYDAKKRGETVERREYPREALRLVSDETWWRCNSKSAHRSGYGGATHPLTGLLHCGRCGSPLVLNAVSKVACRSLYCAVCTTAAQSMRTAGRNTSTIAVAGITELLRHALRYFVSGPLLAAFRESLALRLTGDRAAEVREAEARLAALKKAQERLSRMLANVSEDDATLEQRYVEKRVEAERAAQRLAELRQAYKAVDAEALREQLKCDPRDYLDGLFDAGIPAHRLQAVLARLFPEIEFEGKTARRTSHFRIRFAAGVAVALASGTESILETESEAHFVLCYQQARDSVAGHWTVSVKAQPAPPSAPTEDAPQPHAQIQPSVVTATASAGESAAEARAG